MTRSVAGAVRCGVTTSLSTLIDHWKGNPGGTYRSWFLWEERIKNVRSIRSFLKIVISPTHMPPFNTAIVKGYNALCGTKVKLGSWTEYLAMREGILRLNETHRDQLSNDLGSIAGLLFDLGSGLYTAPPLADDAAAFAAWKLDLAKVRTELPRTAKSADEDRSHTEIQVWLRDLGRALGFDVWIAANDQNREAGAGRLGDGCLSVLPPELASAPGAEAIRLIDVLWLEHDKPHVAAAFEVEHTTSIYSGIIRLVDLALGAPGQATRGLFLVAPDDREDQIRAHLQRPAFRSISSLRVRYLPYSELEQHRGAMARFGAGLKAIEAVARTLV